MELVSGNILVREMRFDYAGDVVQGHAHNFDHTTYVAKGGLLIESLNDDEVLGEPDPATGERPVLQPATVKRTIKKRASDGRNWVLIKAGVKHRITALEDGSLGHCIYAHRTPQGDVIQEYDGWSPAYE